MHFKEFYHTSDTSQNTVLQCFQFLFKEFIFEKIPFFEFSYAKLRKKHVKSNGVLKISQIVFEN